MSDLRPFYGLWVTSLLRGDLRTAQEAAEIFLPRSRKRGADDGSAGRAPQRGHGAPLPGRFHRRRGQSRRGAEDVRSRARSRRQVPVRPGRRAPAQRATSRWQAGLWAMSNGRGRSARRRWRARTRPLTRRLARAFTTSSLAYHMLRGDPETVMRTANPRCRRGRRLRLP